MKSITFGRRIFDPRFAGASRSSRALSLVIAFLAAAAVLTTGNVVASILIFLAVAIAVAFPLQFVFRDHQLASQEARDLWGLTGVIFDGRAWPSPGGWALGADAISLLIREIRSRKLQSVIELGPGTSSIVLGRALPGLDLYGIEHDIRFLDDLHQNLAMHQLENYKLIHAEISSIDVDEAKVDWYETDALRKLPTEIDVLIVDGPPNWRGDGNRSPAWPLLRDRMTDGGLILIDDTNRSDERKMVNRWLDQSEELRLLSDRGSFMVLEIVSIDHSPA